MRVITSRFNKTFNYAKEEVELLTDEGKGLQFTNDDLQQALDRCYQELGGRFTEREYEQWRKSKHEILPNIETSDSD
ncbi:hypothetical protein [Hazenella coriacea]|uniref:hypothetical protein n=1 Tax=Hazenella coriacea TaxID=1179467 RepID=UPI00105108D1|nr:hypothetical protein [Hazenella coriacea]